MQLCSLTEAAVAATRGLGALGSWSGSRGATSERKRLERTRERLGVIAQPPFLKAGSPGWVGSLPRGFESLPRLRTSGI